MHTDHRQPLHHRTWRLGWLMLLLVAGLLCPLPRLHAQAAPAIQLSVEPAFAGNYLIGSWVPLFVTVQNTSPQAAELVLEGRTANTATRYTRTLRLDGGEQRTLTLYITSPQNITTARVRAIPAEGTRVEQTVSVTPHLNARLTGIIGGDVAALSLPTQTGVRVPIIAFPLTAATLPDHAAGLDSLAVLFLADAPAAPLSDAQQRAIINWLWRGGHLLLSGDVALAEVLPLLPASYIPATRGAVIDLDTRALLTDTDTTDVPPLRGRRLQPSDTATVLGQKQAPLLVQGRAGEGLITQAAFDLASPALNTWDAAPRFWNQILQPANPAQEIGTQRRLFESALAGAASMMPTLNLPPATILYGFLIFYALIIGPVAVVVLRRMGQLTRAWVVLPLLALLFLGGSIVLALLLRPDQRLLTRVHIVELTAPGQAFVHSASGILTAGQADFTLELAPDTLLRPLTDTEGRFDPIRGITGALPQQPATLTISASTTIRGLAAVRQHEIPALNAQIILSDEAIQARLENTLDVPLRNAVLLYGEQVASLGDVPPGEVRTVPWPFQMDGAAPPYQGTSRTGAVLRASMAHTPDTDTEQRRMLLRESLIQGILTQKGTGPLVLAWLDEAPPTVQVASTGAASAEETLLLAHADLRASGQIALPAGWLRLAPPAGNICPGGAGIQLDVRRPPVLVPLQLPPALEELRASELQITLDTREEWPNAGVQARLYNWEQAQWEEQDITWPGTLDVATPAPFVREGQVILELDGRINEGECLLVRAEIAGSLPPR